MAVVLEGEQLVDVLGAEVHHPADVVAGQVDQHDVLGDLLGVLLQLAGHAPVVLLAAAPAPRAGDGPGDDPAVDHPHHRLGRRADHRDRRVAHEVHVRRRVDLAQGAVEVERVGAEVEVEAHRQDDLEDVAVQDVLLGHGDRVRPSPRRGGPPDVGRRLLAVGWLDDGLLDRAGAVGGQLVEATERVVVGVVEDGPGGVVGHDDVVDQGDPLPEVVVGGQLADHREHGVGVAGVVAGDVGQVLHLAHDVVAEVADDAAVEGRQVGQRRRAVVRQQGLDGGQHAAIEGNAGGKPAVHLEATVPGDDRGRRPSADERPPAPPVAVLDRLQQEAGPVLPYRAGEGGHRRGQVGQDLPPHRHDPVGAGQRPEVVPTGGHRRRGRSRRTRRCGTRRCPAGR